ncbi:cyclase family protein [Acidiferrimicrobium sp. IK]|uniref:cyclase family protein n=1 Tax=Acidiferrimicrobium sp. IK TaxID=2871700 RepID=UPI0021CB5B72|nr:cyclase family protein [Acidiferrimicrobium sp. IK]MCU4186746.1 cyclase family protein [Acidiferrimicrobium sp. IK]
MTDRLLDVVRRSDMQVFDLGRPMFVGMPQSPNHPQYWHTLPRRHGDSSRADGSSAANDLLVTGTHVGTHIDALAHVSYKGRLHGGGDAAAEQAGGRFMQHGVHTIAPIITRGLLLDVPAALGLDSCPAGYEITVSDLEKTVADHGVRPEAGDVVLIRSGWGRQFGEGTDAYVGRDSGVPGVGEEGAAWLADAEVLAVGADTIAFERLAPGGGHALLPAHRLLLVERGIYIMEALDLEGLGEAGVHEFTFVAIPLNLVGATGSPIRPLAVVGPAS